VRNCATFSHLRGLARGEQEDGTAGTARQTAPRLANLEERRLKLLELFYADQISSDLFSEQKAKFSRQIAALRGSRAEQEGQAARSGELLARFEEVLVVLSRMSIEDMWEEAAEREKRVLVGELIEKITLFPDHLEVSIAGAPKMNVTLQEVGLRAGLQSRGVGGASATPSTRDPWETWLIAV
jgi:hypothetical protein